MAEALKKAAELLGQGAFARRTPGARHAMIAAAHRSSCMRATMISLAFLLGQLGQAQDSPAHAFGITLGTSFHPDMLVSEAVGGDNARFQLFGLFSAAVSYRRWLDTKWYLTGTLRGDIMGYGMRWSGNMEPMGHWARPEVSQVGLPPQEFHFMGLRGDVGRQLAHGQRWAMRAEAGMEMLVLPAQYFGYAHRATVDGQDLPDATVITAMINDEGGPVGRLRLALTGAYTDHRWNEWTLGLAGQLALRKDLIQGRYTVQSPTGPESGNFSGSLNAIEVAVGRYFSWGSPKLPRWATQQSGS